MGAKRLKEEGVEGVVVVEGSDRIGGRIKDAQFGGITVELGANWVHRGTQFKHDDTFGPRYNPIEDLVKKAGLKYTEDRYDDYTFRFKGKNVTAEANERQHSLEEALEFIKKLAKHKEANDEPDVNLRVGLALSDWRPKTPVEKALEFFHFDFEFADEPSDTSLMANADVFKVDPNYPDMFITDSRGYSEIIRDTASKIPLDCSRGNLYLNTVVNEIRREEPGDYKILVNTTDEKTGRTKLFKAKWAVMTFSIGVIESDTVTFVPKLPNWKMETIYTFKMARYIKIFVRFPKGTKAFWDDTHYIFYVDPNVRGRWQLWQNLEAKGKYHPEGTNVLLVTIVGNNWERVVTLTDEQRKQEIFEVLKSMYGDAAVMPEEILVPDWHKNPLFFGAYSNWPIGVNDALYKNMDAAVGNLYMAGEACGQDYTGTIFGAQDSGERTARELVNCMRDSGKCEKIPTNEEGTPVGYGYHRNRTYTESCKRN